MRADRLLQIVALLRQHERMSAAELARRLEVTPRTVMRDIDSLSLAGVPVYAERGRAGGYALLPGYRPDTEQLRPEEARALFVAGGSGVADALGMRDDFDRALRKLATGLPEGQTRDIGLVSDLIVIDPGGWGQLPSSVPDAMTTVFAAVRDGRRLRMRYRSRGAEQVTSRVIDPWGLVLAGLTWYLIAAHRGAPRTYRVDRIQQVDVLETDVRRPARLDLRGVWHELRAAWQSQPTQRVVVRVRRAQADLVIRNLQLVLMGAPERTEDGPEHVLITADVSTLRGVVGVLLGFGTWAEALEPPELRELMLSVADEARVLYVGGSGIPSRHELRPSPGRTDPHADRRRARGQ